MHHSRPPDVGGRYFVLSALVIAAGSLSAQTPLTNLGDLESVSSTVSSEPRGFVSGNATGRVPVSTTHGTNAGTVLRAVLPSLQLINAMTPVRPGVVVIRDTSTVVAVDIATGTSTTLSNAPSAVLSSPTATFDGRAFLGGPLLWHIVD